MTSTPNASSDPGNSGLGKTAVLVFVAALAVVAILVGAIVWSNNFTAKRAEREFDFLQNHGASAAELCSKARQVQEIYAEARDAEAYQQWKLTADIYCRATTTLWG